MTTTTDLLLNNSESLKMDVDNLQNFLLNAKARNWIVFEWFYSDIDRISYLPISDSVVLASEVTYQANVSSLSHFNALNRCLLQNENEFINCMEHFFPELSVKNDSKTIIQLNRHQWNLIRRRFGKPRRLSSSYLNSERIKLAKQRKLLRIIQNESETHYPSEKVFLNNLPQSVILPLKTGARVVVQLFRSHYFGLYRGQFISRDENNRQLYKILFDDQDIGLRDVNDYDVMSEEPLERIQLGNKLKTIKFGQKSENFTNSDNDDEMLTTDDYENTTKTNVITKIPERLLYLIIRVSRILCAKRDAIDNLRKLNNQAEYEISRHIPLSDAFRRDYAHLVQWLAKLNEYLAQFLNEINQICREIVTDEQLLVVFNDTTFVCDRAQKLAKNLIDKLNISSMVVSQQNLELITKLVALVVQMKEFSESEGSFLELHALDDANENFKKSIHPSLLTTYKQCVESSVTQFKSGLNNRPGLGLLQAFLHTQSESDDPQTNNSSINQTFFSV